MTTEGQASDDTDGLFVFLVLNTMQAILDMITHPVKYHHYFTDKEKNIRN